MPGRRPARRSLIASKTVGDADPARAGERRYRGHGIGEERERVQLDSEAALAVAEDVVGLSQTLGDGHFVAHDEQSPVAVRIDDEGGGTAVVPPVATEVVHVVGAEDHAAVDVLGRHPRAQALESVRWPLARDPVGEHRVRGQLVHRSPRSLEHHAKV